MKNFSFATLSGHANDHSRRSTGTKLTKKSSGEETISDRSLYGWQPRYGQQEEKKLSSTDDTNRMVRSYSSSNMLNKKKTPKKAGRKSLLLDLRSKENGREDSNVVEFIDSMKKKTKRRSVIDKASQGLQELDLVPSNKRAESLLNDKPKTRRSYSKEDSLEDEDLDKILKLVSKMKQSENGKQLLTDFVNKQAGCPAKRRSETPDLIGKTIQAGPCA